jgi:hypothetical protein
MEHTVHEYLMLVATETSDHCSNKFSPRRPRILMKIGFKPSGGVTNEQGRRVGNPEMPLSPPSREVLLGSALPQFWVGSIELRQFHTRTK